MPHTTPRTAAGPASATRLGDRVRQLRVSAGLTQTDLAGTRFSKEYVSQIERGKTRPTRETVEWLAQRLGVDADFLQNGVSTDERSRIETMLARAEALAEAHECDRAIEQIEDARTASRTPSNSSIASTFRRASISASARASDESTRPRSSAETPLAR